MPLCTAEKYTNTAEGDAVGTAVVAVAVQVLVREAS